MVTYSVLAASDYIRLACFRMCWCKRRDMIVKKHLIGQTVIVPYMENTDSDILRLRLTSSLMWISNRGHVFRIGGIILHPTGVFSNVLMQKKRHDCRKTSDWAKSDCSVHGIYRQRYIRVTVNFFINVDIKPWSRLPFRRHHITSDWRVFECVDAK